MIYWIFIVPLKPASSQCEHQMQHDPKLMLISHRCEAPDIQVSYLFPSLFPDNIMGKRDFSFLIKSGQLFFCWDGVMEQL